eukprot:TRINITY_DN2764_c0_g1_i1.p1 TRINITY_DN2764_c0_g1~~TRINITY_DN2764_c0_g1_i1.p1  ORF type:complete len:445 (-),score=49.46 TRINITY_DN2764_c0_g1_i1:234-1568(-)
MLTPTQRSCTFNFYKVRTGPFIQHTRNHKRPAFKTYASILTDTNIPEEHKELHSYLYGSTEEQTHEQSDMLNQKLTGEDTGEFLIPIGEYLNARESIKQLAVYAIYDKGRELQYVGYSRNVVATVRGLTDKVGTDRCQFIRVMVYSDRRMATRSEMEELATKWIDQAEKVPPGNSYESELWSNGNGIVRKLSDLEFEQYADLKTKLKMAMGERISDNDQPENQKIRRLKTIQAVEADDWSAVISEQTELQLNNMTSSLKQPAAQQQIISPFQNQKALSNDSSEDDGDTVRQQQTKQLTKDTVEQELEQVRPYLIADGGNVKVHDILPNGNVVLELEGACIGCPSSSTTIKMGIERCLRNNFGDQINEIITMNADVQKEALSPDIVNDHLKSLGNLKETYGIAMNVIRIQGGTCEMEFTGSQAIASGIQAALISKFNEIQKVVFV